MRVLWISLISLLFAAGQLQAELKVEKLGTDYYKLAWSGTRLEEVLPELYEQMGVQSFAKITGETKSVDVKDWLTGTREAASCVGHPWGRDSRKIGVVTVFYPYFMFAINDAGQMTAAQLALSLSSTQMEAMAANGGVAYQDLTKKQKEFARYLVEMQAIRGRQFPEPELSKRLEAAHIVLSFHPSISFDYPSPGGYTASGFYLDSAAEAELLTKWAPGQREAARMISENQTQPGDDVPGDSTEWELRGVYRLRDILKMIQDSTDSPVRSKVDQKTQLVAYCKLTAAGLARACATALGTSWYSESGKWTLGSKEDTEAFSTYANQKTSNDYFTEYDKLKIKLTPIARSKQCVYISDEGWADPHMFTQMVEMKPVTYSELTQQQKDYLQTKWKQQVTVYKQEGKMPELPELKMRWDPKLKLCISTEDANLYNEWLDYSLK